VWIDGWMQGALESGNRLGAKTECWGVTLPYICRAGVGLVLAIMALSCRSSERSPAATSLPQA
jgi:hypothetical protein